MYGCRSQAGGSAATPRPQNPCVRANNLSTGLAFEFNAANGDIGGLISVGGGGDAKKPLTTNATGVATGLNADDPGAGDYNVVFTGDLSACGLSATVTGTAPGMVTVTPTVAADKATTAVDVRTFDGAGAAADRPFHLVANC